MDAYDRHEFTHTGVKKYQCVRPNCSQAYTNSSHLRRHHRTAHSTVKKEHDIPCDFNDCLRVFGKRSQMKNHYNQKHLLVRDQQCHLCPAKFHRKHHLKKHMFQHTNEYPYKCAVCDKGAVTLKQHERHTASHKKYECGDCNEVFDKWSLLTDHRRSNHLPVCAICWRPITNKRAHMRLHQVKSECPAFACPHAPCTKSYNQRRNLQSHIRRKHLKIEPTFQCDYCQEFLSTKQKITQHLLKYHADGQLSVPAKGRRGTRKKKPRSSGRYFSQRLSSAAILTGLSTSAKVEELVVAGRGNEIKLIELNKAMFSDDEEIAVVAILPDGSEVSSSEN